MHGTMLGEGVGDSQDEGVRDSMSVDFSLESCLFINTRSFPDGMSSSSLGRFGMKRSGVTGRTKILIDTVELLVGDTEDRFFSESFGGVSLTAAVIR